MVTCYILVTAILVVVGTINANNNEYRYKGELLTPEAVQKYAPEMPPELTDVVHKHYEQHKGLYSQALADPTWDAIEQQKEAFYKQLPEHGITNCGISSNLELQHSDLMHGKKKYSLNISALDTRIMLILCSHQLEPIINDEKKWGLKVALGIAWYNKLPILPTYQTLSNIAAYLLEKEYLEKHPYSSVGIVDSYLYKPYPDQLATDSNAIEVREVMHGISLVNGSPVVTELTYQHFKDLFDIIVATGVAWPLDKGRLMLKDGKIIIRGSEQQDRTQPNNTKQDTGFYYGPRKKHIDDCAKEHVFKLVGLTKESLRLSCSSTRCS